MTPPDMHHSGDDLIAVTMTREAAQKLKRALTYGESLIYSHVEAQDPSATRARMEEHAKWLRWALSRVMLAERES